MIITATPGIEGMKIKRYLGIVSGEAIMGASFNTRRIASGTVS